jgi:hypothetical protein
MHMGHNFQNCKVPECCGALGKNVRGAMYAEYFLFATPHMNFNTRQFPQQSNYFWEAFSSPKKNSIVRGIPAFTIFAAVPRLKDDENSQRRT